MVINKLYIQYIYNYNSNALQINYYISNINIYTHNKHYYNQLNIFISVLFKYLSWIILYNIYYIHSKI